MIGAALLVLLLGPSVVVSFVPLPWINFVPPAFQIAPRHFGDGDRIRTTVVCRAAEDSNSLEVFVNTQLDDDKVTSLFAWVSLAFRGDPEYNNLMLAIAAIFGNLPPTSVPVQMAQKARNMLPPEEELVGDKFSIEEREYNSLG